MEMPTNSALKVKRATYGAIGSALGTGAGVLAALLFMAGMYFFNRKTILKRVAHDKHEHIESYGQIVKMITLIVTTFILSTAAYNLSSVVNSKMYVDVMPKLLGWDGTAAYHDYGIFSGMAQTISNIPIAFASAMAAAMIPSVASMLAAGQIGEAREKIGVAVKSTMIISIPAAVGLFALAKPLTALLFPSQPDEVLTYAGYLLMSLALSVVFYALSTLNSSILQGLGKVNTPIVNAALALVVQTVTVYALLRYTRLDLYSLSIVNTLYSGMMFWLNQWAVKRAVGYRQEMRRTFYVPALAAAVMGAIGWGVYEILYLFTESMRIAVLPAILVAVIAYFILLLELKGLTEKELLGFPKGYLVVRIAKKCRLL